MGYLLRKRGQNGTICYAVCTFLAFYLRISFFFCNFAAAIVKTRMKAWGSIWDMKHKS